MNLGVFIFIIYFFFSGIFASAYNGSKEETAAAAAEAEAKQPKIESNFLHLRFPFFNVRCEASYLRRKRDSSPSSPTELRPLHSIGHSRWWFALKSPEGQEASICLREALMRRFYQWSDWAGTLHYRGNLFFNVLILPSNILVFPSALSFYML